MQSTIRRTAAQQSIKRRCRRSRHAGTSRKAANAIVFARRTCVQAQTYAFTVCMMRCANLLAIFVVCASHTVQSHVPATPPEWRSVAADVRKVSCTSRFRRTSRVACRAVSDVYLHARIVCVCLCVCACIASYGTMNTNTHAHTCIRVVVR